jgi:hypothetical protein
MLTTNNADLTAVRRHVCEVWRCSWVGRAQAGSIGSLLVTTVCSVAAVGTLYGCRLSLYR